MARERRHISRRRRRGRFGFVYKLLSVLAVAIAVIVACVVFFRINEVTVTGNSRYTADEIIKASGIEIGDNLIALRESQTASRIRTQLPYVYSVSIDRALPDGVILKITEHTAAAAIPDAGGWWYISAQGKLLEQTASPGAMRVSGLTAVNPYAGEPLQVEEGSETTLTYVLALLTELEKREMLPDCTALDCTAATSILLTYDIYDVKLPRTTDYSKCLSLLLGALGDERMPENTPGSFDLTVEDGKAFFTRKSSQE